MIAEVLCYWCACLVVNQNLAGCLRCGQGDRADAIKAMSTIDEPGVIQVTECVKPGQKSAIDWSTKQGFTLK